MESIENRENVANIEDTPAPEKRGRGVLLGVLGFLLALGALLLWVYHGVKPIVRSEYGQGVPPAAAFCPDEGAMYLADESCGALGDHVIYVSTGVRLVPCLLIVRDTVAPAASPVTVTFASGYQPTPDQFIADLVDADRVGVRFAEAYDFSAAGTQTVRILLEDGSGNQSEVAAEAQILATVDRVTLEAGDPAPAAEAYCAEGFHGVLLTEVTDDMRRTPGEYPQQLQCVENGRIFPSTLVVEDTVPPTGAGQLLILSPGEEPAPEAFLTAADDVTPLSYSFAIAPDPKSRAVQDIAIRLTDLGGNTTDVPAQALYSTLGPLTVEAKFGLLTGADLGRPNAEPETFQASVPGTYFVRVRVDNVVEMTQITLVDTTGPLLTQKEGPFYTHHALSPEDLVEARDVSGATLSFVEAPDTDSDQPQTFTVRAVDELGNETVASFPLTLAVDDTPPVLYGVVNASGYVGEPIAYLHEAYAEDDVDGRVALTVESEVILSKKGKYTVTYTAADQSGNTASKSITYTLVEPAVSDEEVRAMAQGVLSDILQPDMVTAEKLLAVFEYVRGRIHYTGVSNKTDWRREAVRGNKEGKGDCFTVYCLTRSLLDELSIPYMSVTRRGGSSRHYWLIVNIGTGWYHFDPLVTRVHKHRCFMWTTQQCLVKPYFWRFYEENYPPIATEPFDYDAVVRQERGA